jgi:hypothetical protein
MKFFLTVLVLGASLALAPSAELPFPEWRGGELAELQSKGWQPGALLLTDDPLPGDLAPAATESVPSPLPEEIANDSAPATEIPEPFLEAYFAARPDRFLIDPQGLLSPADLRDRSDFLTYHASDSSIDFFVYVMGGDQEIPADVRDEELIERFFTEGRPALVVHYYLGNPKRSTVQLSPSLSDQISLAEQHRALESSIMMALEKNHPSDQLDKFLVQMSIRIYWMERLIADGSKAADGSASEGMENSGSAAEKEIPDRFLKIRELLLPFVMPSAAILAGLMLLYGGLFVLRMRARYQFPEFEVEPRLGGDHAAGIGAVISFASAAVPPASQRDQIPEYLRRA